jgi:hypothetical protein
MLQIILSVTHIVQNLKYKSKKIKLILKKETLLSKKNSKKNLNKAPIWTSEKKAVNFPEKEMSKLDLGSCQAAFQHKLEAFYLGIKWPVL